MVTIPYQPVVSDKSESYKMSNVSMKRENRNRNKKLKINMEEDYCCICKAKIAFTNKVDIQLTTTPLSQMNLQEFIKTSIIEIIAFKTNYVCQPCHNSLIQLEDYLIKYKEIQQTLVNKYLTKEASQVSIKVEIFEGEQTFDQTDSNESSGFQISKEKGNNINNPGKSRKIKKENKEETKKQPKTKEVNNSKQKREEKKSFCCETCGKQYESSSAFRKHIHIHKYPNSFQCEFCKKCFTQKVGLKRHLPIHTGEHQYQCDLCGKQFIHSTSFDKHKRYHLGIKRYHCKICGFALMSQSHLTRHMKVHTSEKTFGCSHCGRLFAERYNLTSHIKKVHNITKEDENNGRDTAITDNFGETSQDL